MYGIIHQNEKDLKLLNHEVLLVIVAHALKEQFYMYAQLSRGVGVIPEYWDEAPPTFLF